MIFSFDGPAYFVCIISAPDLTSKINVVVIKNKFNLFVVREINFTRQS